MLHRTGDILFCSYSLDVSGHTILISPILDLMLSLGFNSCKNRPIRRDKRSNRYSEMHGSRSAPVMLYGGGSATVSTFGRYQPVLVNLHREIDLALQIPGHTPVKTRPLSFEGDANGLADLFRQLQIQTAECVGVVSGDTACPKIRIRLPDDVGTSPINKIPAMGFCPIDGK
jgi:hypothetical protein